MLDPPAHTQVRQALLGPFRPRAVTPLEPTGARARAGAPRRARRPRRPFDVRHDYASPVAAQVAALQLGFPVEDAELLVGWVNTFVERDPDVPGSARRARLRTPSSTRTSSISSPSGAPPRGDGPPDLIDDLCAYAGAHGPLDDSEIAVQLSTLFIGGSETLPKTVAGGAYELWRATRATRRAGRADPVAVPNAFEEMLRHQLPLQFVGRTADRRHRGRGRRRCAPASASCCS